MQEHLEHKLFVGGLPTDIKEDDLTSVFGTYGEVVKVHLMEANSKGSRAAFVFYTNRNSGDDAITVLHGIYKIRADAPYAIQVKWANQKGEGKGSPEEAAPSPDGYKLFVGNLPAEVVEEELRTVFSTYGELEKIHLMDASGASNQRCGFVFYKMKNAADDAISVLHNIYKIRENAETPIVVKWATDKKAKGKDGGKGKGKDDQGKGKGYSDSWSSQGPYGAADGKGKGKGSKAAPSWESAGWDRGRQQDNSWSQPPQSSWQGSSWQDSSSRGGQNSWGGSSGGGSADWSGSDRGGGSSWGGSDRGHDKGGKASWDRGSDKGSKGGWDSGGNGKGGKSYGKADEGRGTQLFVGNLPADIPETSVQYVFKTYGTIQKIKMLTDKPNAAGSVSAIVEYTDPDEAATAIAALHEKYEIQPGYGNLQVKHAKQKIRSAPY